MERIKVGQVVNVVGLKGELKVYHYSDYKERFEELPKIYLENTRCEISGVRYIKDMVILKLKGIDDRTEAEKHKGESIYIDKSDVRYCRRALLHFDLIGIKVVDESGNTIGTLCA
jgi:16S rRNA processing protein RimM